MGLEPYKRYIDPFAFEEEISASEEKATSFREIALNHLTMRRYSSFSEQNKDRIADYVSGLVSSYQGDMLSVSDVEAFSTVSDSINTAFPVAVVKETFLKIHERLTALSTDEKDIN